MGRAPKRSVKVGTILSVSTINHVANGTHLMFTVTQCPRSNNGVSNQSNYFYLLYAETEMTSSRYSDDVAIASIVIAVISLLTSVTTTVIMVCLVVLFLKRNSVTEEQIQCMDIKQNTAYATVAEQIPKQQDTTYESLDLYNDT